MQQHAHSSAPPVDALSAVLVPMDNQKARDMFKGRSRLRLWTISWDGNRYRRLSKGYLTARGRKATIIKLRKDHPMIRNDRGAKGSREGPRSTAHRFGTASLRFTSRI